MLSEQKAKMRLKRVTSRKKQKEVEPIQGLMQEEDKVNMFELQVSAGEEKLLLMKMYNFYWAQGKIYLNNGRDILELEAG